VTAKRIIWVIAAILLVGLIYAQTDYFSYRMNFPPGESRQHLQTITFTGNLTIIKPSSFTFSDIGT